MLQDELAKNLKSAEWTRIPRNYYNYERSWKFYTDKL